MLNWLRTSVAEYSIIAGGSAKNALTRCAIRENNDLGRVEAEFLGRLNFFDFRSSFKGYLERVMISRKTRMPFGPFARVALLSLASFVVDEPLSGLHCTTDEEDGSLMLRSFTERSLCPSVSREGSEDSPGSSSSGVSVGVGCPPVIVRILSSIIHTTGE